jgi:hypothetical protein
VRVDNKLYLNDSMADWGCKSSYRSERAYEHDTLSVRQNILKASRTDVLEEVNKINLSLRTHRGEIHEHGCLFAEPWDNTKTGRAIGSQDSTDTGQGLEG